MNDASPAHRSGKGAQVDDALALVRAAHQREPGAVERLLEHYGPRVFACAMRMTEDAAAAEEITHDVFLALIRTAPRFRGDASPATWLHRATMNRCRDHLRTRRRSRTVGLNTVHHAIAGELRSDLRVQNRERDDILAAAVAQLPDDLREVVILRFGAGLSYDEIAALMHSPKGSVASRLHRAVRRLGELLRTRGVERETI